MLKFHENAIITGCVDCYCLVCDNYLRSEEDADSHIKKPIHKKNLVANNYVQKYEDDHIRKVKEGYFCEFCNLLFTTAFKVDLHVAEQKHNYKKGTQLLKRVGNTVVSSNNVFINEKAWNGLLGDTCVICNVEFYSEHIHKTEPKHVLNLIQKEIGFGVGGTIYRKIDNTYFQCLTCNIIFSLETLATHCDNGEHKKLFKKCRESAKPKPKAEVKYSNDEFSNTAAHTAAVTKQPESNIVNFIKIETNTVQNNIENAKKPTTVNMTNVTPDIKFNQGKQNDKDLTKDRSNKTIDNGKQESCVKDNTTTFLDGDTKTHVEKVDTPSKPVQEIKLTSPSSNKNDAVQNTTEPDKMDVTTQVDESDEPMKMKVKSSRKSKTNTKESKNNGPDKNEPAKQYDKANILDSVPDFQKNGISINFEIETAFCKKCFENVELDYDAIEKHIVEHKNKPNKSNSLNMSALNTNHSKTVLKEGDKPKQNDIATAQDLKKVDENHNFTKRNGAKSLDNKENDSQAEDSAMAVVRHEPLVTEETLSQNPNKTNQVTNIPDTNDVPTADDCIIFAKANNLTFNKKNSNAYCRLCSARLPATLRSMKEHVAGANHRNNSSKALINIPRRTMKKFIKSRIEIEDDSVDDIVINDMICLTRLSFLMITKIGARYRCQACEVNLLECDIGHHVYTSRHDMAMDDTPVVLNLDPEFIREVRSGLFHCGFCNLIVGCWDDVDKHLKCADHRDNKSEASSRLQDHMPEIMEYRERTKFNFIRTILLARLGSFF